MLLPHRPLIPLWIKLPYTLLVAVIVVIYWIDYGPANFLWFSDIALIAAVAALWLENRLLAGMMTLTVGLPEIAWNIDFFLGLAIGRSLLGLTWYMFDPGWPLYLRALSLFHVFLPPLLFWMVWRLGYDRRALLAQTLLAWLVLWSTYLLTDPAKNINWVADFQRALHPHLPPPLHVVAMMILFPLCIYLPTHLLLRALVPPNKQRDNA